VDKDACEGSLFEYCLWYDVGSFFAPEAEFCIYLFPAEIALLLLAPWLGFAAEVG